MNFIFPVEKYEFEKGITFCLRSFFKNEQLSLFYFKFLKGKKTLVSSNLPKNDNSVKAQTFTSVKKKTLMFLKDSPVKKNDTS